MQGLLNVTVCRQGSTEDAMLSRLYCCRLHVVVGARVLARHSIRASGSSQCASLNKETVFTSPWAFAAANTRRRVLDTCFVRRVSHYHQHHSKECRFALQTWTGNSTKADVTYLLEKLTVAQLVAKDPPELPHSSHVLTACYSVKDLHVLT